MKKTSNKLEINLIRLGILGYSLSMIFVCFFIMYFISEFIIKNNLNNVKGLLILISVGVVYICNVVTPLNLLVIKLEKLRIEKERINE